MRIVGKIINKITQGPYWVMYDNECQFCCRIMRVIHRLDTFNKIQWIDKNWDGRFPDEGRKNIAHTIVVFNPIDNKLYYKTSALFKILMCIPFGFLISWILKIPLLSNLFDYLYDKVASNRKCATNEN